jgi:hypothetical protein
VPIRENGDSRTSCGLIVMPVQLVELTVHLGGGLERLVRDRDVTDHPEDVEVELLEALAGLVPDPADSDVGPRLEGIHDGLPACGILSALRRAGRRLQRAAA